MTDEELAEMKRQCKIASSVWVNSGPSKPPYIYYYFCSLVPRCIAEIERLRAKNQEFKDTLDQIEEDGLPADGPSSLGAETTALS